jgi:hypothetical protein
MSKNPRLEELKRAAEWYYEEREEYLRLKKENEALREKVFKLRLDIDLNEQKMDEIQLNNGSYRRLVNAAINYAKRKKDNNNSEFDTRIR